MASRPTPDIPSASMADIAFLLLVFFLVTTTIANDKGLSLQLPPPPDPAAPQIDIPQRNLFTIIINSNDDLLVENEPMPDVSGLKQDIKDFILNRGADPTSSDDPTEAIVSIKTDRGTSHERFIEILDIAQGAYYDIYAERIGVSNDEFRAIASDLNSEENQAKYEQARGKLPDGRTEIPMNLSIADPTNSGS